MLIHQFALGLFRIIAALTRTLVLAYAAAWLMFLIVLLMGGFILNKDSIHPWWIGAYWTLPMQYLQNGLAVNEFTGGEDFPSSATSWAEVTKLSAVHWIC